MKVVLNKCYGGFSLSTEADKILNLTRRYDTDRTDERLIALIEKHGSKWVSGTYAHLAIVDIPDRCTDWEINEYDGYEDVTYVVDGKLYHA